MALTRPLGAPEASPLDVGRSSWREEARATLLLGLPLIAAQLAQIAINTTDTLMMGRLGPEALAAGTLGNTLQFVLLVTGIGLTAAVGARVAQERGARSSAVREPRRTVRQGFWTVTLFGLPCVVVIWNGGAVLGLLGQDPALIAAAEGYFRAVVWGFVPALWFMILRAFVSALERPGMVLWITLGAVATNAFLNWVLMFGNLGAPALGITGTGIATSITNIAMFGALALFVARDRTLRRYRLAGRLWRADWSRFLAILRVGAPIAGLLLAEVGAFAGSTAMSGAIGTETLAAHAIALQIAGVAFMVPLGLSQATTVRVGLAAGRGRGVGRAGGVSIAMALGFAATTAALFVAVPGPLVAAFIDPGEAAATAALAVTFLGIAAVFQFVDALQVVLAAALRGLNDTAVPLAVGLFGYWGVGLPLGAALAFGWLGDAMGGTGVWIGLATGLTVVALLLGWRWTLDAVAWRDGPPAGFEPGSTA